MCCLTWYKTKIGTLYLHDTWVCGLPLVAVARGGHHLARMTTSCMIAGGKQYIEDVNSLALWSTADQANYYEYGHPYEVLVVYAHINPILYIENSI